MIRGTRFPLVTSMLLLLAFGLVGCGGQSSREVVQPEPLSIDASGTVTPGLIRRSASDAEAVGTVVYRRDQGGFFAVTNITTAATSPSDIRILAILVHEDGTLRREDLAPLVGVYCRFIGSVVQTESPTFTAPLLSFDTVHILSRPSQDDQ